MTGIGKADAQREKQEAYLHEGSNEEEVMTGVDRICEASKDYRETGLKRNLKPRHLIFISIGSSIGTGIFLGVGTSLKNGGPLGLLLGFSVIASVVVCIMFMVSELVTFLPVAGGHIRLTGRFVDPALSAIMGWNYIICWTLILAAELSAAAVLVSFWIPENQVNQSLWVAIGSAIVLGLNAFGSGFFGEAEYWFASIKIVTLTSLIIISIVITAGGNPQGEVIGFKYWHHPGALVQYEGIPGSKGRFLGFFAVLVQATFSMNGAEMLALAAAECRNPRKVLPICMRTVWIRIVGFYVISVFMVGLIIPHDHKMLGSSSTAEASPYVIAIKAAGIHALPSVINGAILTSALSAGCSDLFTTSRALYALAQKGQAPSIFARTLRSGVPHYALLGCWLVGSLAYLGSSSSSATVFNFLTNLTALGGIVTWFCIAITYLRFRAGMKAQNIPHSVLPWKSCLTLAGAYWTLLAVSIVAIFSGWTVFRPGYWDTSTFFSNYLPLVWFIGGYLFFKYYWKTKIISVHEMDFVTGLDEIEEDARIWDAEDATYEQSGLTSRLLAWF
ncbi:hypothetical protein ACQY0O_005855 [Thecaphora frezii]